MKIGVTGASGFVGSGLVKALEERGDSVLRLVRRKPRSELEAQWSVKSGIIDTQSLSELEAVIHLAGESVSKFPWTPRRRRKIRESRVLGTRALVRSLANLPSPPKIFICASAIGFYGSRGNERLSEGSTAGEGFLANVVRDWEAEANVLASDSIRVVNARISVVLDRDGGALKRMLPAFRLGLGGKLGDGKQWFSFISKADCIRALVHLLDTDSLRGPVNLSAPAPVTNAEFTKSLSKLIDRPARIDAPAWALKAGLGDFAREMLLVSQQVFPERLLSTDFEFQHPDINQALEVSLSGS